MPSFFQRLLKHAASPWSPLPMSPWENKHRPDDPPPPLPAIRPKLPRDFTALRLKNGVRLRIFDIDALLNRSSSVKYRFRWANGVDGSTQKGLDAGFARSVIIGSIDAPGKDDAEASLYISDSTYANGYFFCTGIDATGTESYTSGGTAGPAGEYASSSLFTNDILDYAIPGDVKHFSASESGEVANGTTFSALSYSCQAPTPISSFAGVQFYLGDYPNIGQMSAWVYHRFNGVAGASLVGKELYAVCRRTGVGTVTATGGLNIIAGVGTNFPLIARVGDLFECLGLRGSIISVDSATQLTLTNTFPGNKTFATQAFVIIGKVTVYAVSVSKAGTHRSDIESAPNALVLFDGDLSAPAAPGLAATQLGNNTLLTITPVNGTQIDHYVIYRGTGAGVAFASCTSVKTFPSDVNNTAGALQFVDTSFTTYQRARGQVFSYYATAVNVRGDEGAASTRVEQACRLDSPADGAPTIPAAALPINLLNNSYIYGVAATQPALEAAQDTYSGAAPAGYYRWNANATVTFPTYQNLTEVKLPANAGFSIITQRIDAWDNAATANLRIDKGKDLMLSIYAKGDNATPPNGSFKLQIAMVNAAGTDIGFYSSKVRAANDTFDYTEGGATPIHIIAGSTFTQTFARYYCPFSPQTIPAAVDRIEVRIQHAGTTNGTNIIVTKAMLHFSDGSLAAWTPLLSTVIFPSGTGAIPPPPADRDGLAFDRALP